MTSKRTTGSRDSSLEGWELHWESVKRAVDIRAASVGFALVVVCTGICLSLFADHVESYFYSMNIAVKHRDLRYFNSYGDFLLQNYLNEQPVEDEKECVLLGASFIASTHEPVQENTIQGQLEKRLCELTGEKWRCVSLAASAAVTWCYFYEARLLRLHRPPDALIVSLDGQDARVRNMHLVLDMGVLQGDLTIGELAFALPLNRQPLYVCEANVEKWLRDNLALFRAWNYATYSRPTRTDFGLWLSHLYATVRGVEMPAVLEPDLHVDGTPKSWMEIPVNKARIELMKKDGHKLYWDEKLPSELELLFDELDRCREQGIRVIVTALPLNPAVPQHPGRLGEYVAESTTRHGLEFHGYWQSGIVPTEYFFDNGHFFGEGCRIMADELAGLVVSAKSAEKG
jgi:hypothetical protein